MKYSQILEFARSLRKNQTPAENIFWQNVRNRKFLGLKFNRQFVIEHGSQNYFIADFHCFEKKFIIEIDGDIHRYQLEYDRIREDILKEMGYSIIRFRNEDVLSNWDEVKNKLKEKLSPGSSLPKEGKEIFPENFRGELKRIAVIGPESTGKSELCRRLAEHFQTEWVPEYARAYLDELERPYQKKDLTIIAKGQLEAEQEKAKISNHYLFCDTNLIVIKIWSDHRYGTTDPWIEDQLAERKYDFYLLNNIDLPWDADPQREHPTLRAHFFSIYEDYLKERGLPYAIVSGIEGERINSALNAIETYFNSF